MRPKIFTCLTKNATAGARAAAVWAVVPASVAQSTSVMSCRHSETAWNHCNNDPVNQESSMNTRNDRLEAGPRKASASPARSGCTVTSQEPQLWPSARRHRCGL
ncbi:hypothetical protein COT97_05820 [Candidatus Falkowbacteria bacterium CG10_big_fil_rev_8_21_14_0_10_39_11]|uniref:Secreted protein n=1 Tax=Candidatus Falkowbacteria bacterium CG10_big_fil_rev_8_21_14_0_10_39_11 TaxID=1974565 RepID=A0A2H0V3A4_9BACT|nr:MAG: hypothetical protein COT97_05820 [Candidatus Falkowbacteria bacterium CG10_big_fil_rev_8_21_14_0_10_39_11]